MQSLRAAILSGSLTRPAWAPVAGCSASRRHLNSRRRAARKAGEQQVEGAAEPLPPPLPPPLSPYEVMLRAAEPPPPPPPLSPYEFMLAGKRFTCTSCGKCCQGSGEVWANDAELAALARSQDLPLQHFLTRFTKSYSKKPGWRMLKVQPNGDCIFLKDGTQCSVYGVRPMQCSTYPWWPELMDDVAWIEEGKAVCEGIEHETALPVDAQEKAAVLRAATDYFTEQAVAAEAGRREGGKRQA